MEQGSERTQEAGTMAKRDQGYGGVNGGKKRTKQIQEQNETDGNRQGGVAKTRGGGVRKDDSWYNKCGMKEGDGWEDNCSKED